MKNYLRPAALVVLGFVLGFGLAQRFSFSGSSYFPRDGEGPSKPQSLQKRLKSSEERYARNQDDLSALVDMGVAYYFMGSDHYADALNAFNGAWRQGALDKRIFYYTGILYENLSLFAQAQKQYERFLKHVPEDREIQLRLARLLFRSGKWEEAVHVYRKFIEKNPKDATALINLGLAHQKKMEAASPAAQKGGKALSAEEQSARETDRNEAVKYLEQARALSSPLPEGVESALSKLYAEQGRWDLSVLSAEAELKNNPDDKESLRLWAVACEKSGQKEKALEAYTRLMEKDAQNRVWKQKVKALSPKPRK